jgi:alpha-beta hydrolase superfamily lysophospholipase
MLATRVVAIGAALVGAWAGLVANPETATAQPADPPREYTGTLEGAKYRVVVPEDWNGTLVLFSHGYFPGEFFPGGELPFHPVANRTETEAWLLGQGFALAASLFQGGGLDYQLGSAVQDQSRLLDWIQENVGPPQRTIAYGQSLGAVTAIHHAEQEPDRIDGVLTIGGVMDPVGHFDAILDMNVATKVLLTDGTDANGNPIEIVDASDPQASRAALLAAIQAATQTPQGRARLALIAALNTVTGWYDAHEPRPTDRDDWILGQAAWLHDAYTLSLGPTGRADLEAKVGGNPSTTVGVDYARQLARSGDRSAVRAAYRAAGLDLDADLASLDAEPRIAADPVARATMTSHRPQGTTPSPVLTLHTTGDGGAPPAQERSFADQVRRAGAPSNVRSLYVDRGAHLSLNAAEEIVALQTLLHKVETGRWPSLSPRHLNRAAQDLGPDYFLVLDLVTFVDAPHDPAFARFEPSRATRPSW